MHLPSHLDKQLVAMYRGWDQLERALTEGSPVIDFDLADPADAATYRTRAEVYQALLDIKEHVEAHPLGRGVKSLVIARLTASLAYLRELEGHRAPFDRYILETLGVEPTPFPEEVLTKQRAVANRALASLGGNDSRLSVDEASSLQFQSRFLIRDETKIDRQFAFYLSKWLPAQRQLLSRCLPQFKVDVSLDPDVPDLQHWAVVSRESPALAASYDVHISFASADAYWKNWISGNLAHGRIDLRINVHSRHTWFAGAPEILVLHEYCGHALQMMLWRYQIAIGSLAQFAGILTVHFPDQVLIEGLAEAVTYILPAFAAQSLERTSVVLREVQYFTLLVLNNAHIIANRSSSIAEAVEYASQRLPFFGRDRLERELQARRNNPVFRAYQFSYALGKTTFLKLYESLSHTSQLDFLALVYSQPLLYDQLEAAGNALRERDGKTGGVMPH